MQQVPAITADDSDARVLAFAAGLRRLRAVRAAIDAAVRTLLVLGVPWLLGAWLLPQHLLGTTLSVLAIAATAATIAALRARAVADALLLRGAAGNVAPGDLTILGDELATWLEWQRRAGASQPMTAWLGHDVAARLPAIDAPALQHVGRRRLGRLRYLVAAIVLLLLAWLLSFWFQPPWPGLLGGKPEAVRPVVPPQVGIVPGPDGQPEPKPGEQGQPPPRRPEPPPPGGPPPAGNKQEPAEPEPPAPLLNLPEQRHFVIPEHIDDGPTRRMRMHAAELAESGAASAPPPTAQGGQDEVPAPPPPTRETFEHAREQALRSRHVPAEEQPIVRRFFDLLQKAAK